MPHDDIIARYAGDPFGLIPMLEDVQAHHGYLPADVLKEVARRTGRSEVEIYGVATFYRAFSLKRRGKHVCAVCVGTACHVRGARIVEEELERRLGVPAGQTTADREFTLETQNCLGACALGPIVVMDGQYHSKVTTEKARKLLDAARANNGEAPVDGPTFPLGLRCPRCTHTLMNEHHPIDGRPSIHLTVAFAQTHGWVRLSCLYGSYAHESEHEVPLETVVSFFCPHCSAQLESPTNCPSCAAHMVPLSVRGGGLALICARRGCRTHMLNLDGADIADI